LFKQRLNKLINNYLLIEHKVYLNLILLMQITDIIIEDINVLSQASNGSQEPTRKSTVTSRGAGTATIRGATGERTEGPGQVDKP